MKEKTFLSIIDLQTIIWMSSIILCFVLGAIYIYHCKKNRKLTSNRRWIEQIPSLISTLGVLGTFWGITYGLLEFDSNVLDKSIPLLLDGLKTAFFTSLAGMTGSMILSRLVSKVFDDEDGGVSDINVAAGEIVKAVKEMSETNISMLTELKTQSEQQAKKQEAFYMGASAALSAMKINTETIANKINEIYSSVGEIAISSEIISSVNEDIAHGIQQFGEFLHGEVVDIEGKMTETNQLLNEKFDEFTELLKKSNTEALVEVMKSVTAEFQKQMNALISRLVQENFEQLNQSVERLNIWQQENKEMISSLISQYQQMANNFEETSNTLSLVGDDTRLLVSDGGKLHQLITSLNKVIVEDEHFIEISANLSQTAALSKSNMEEFEESTKSLNEWVKKQRNFVDGVTLLIEKLDELNKIRDYNEVFWKDTKQRLEEGVGYITKGSQSLNEQLTNLDRQFYARLSATLAELDTCISAMVKKHN